MKNIRDLAGHYLRFNKKRSLITVFGISLAVVLFFTFITLFFSVWTSMIEMSRAGGDFEVSAGAIDSDTYKKLLEDSKVDKILISNKIDTNKMIYIGEEGDYRQLFETEVGAFDEDMMGITLVEGEYPKTVNEIIVGEDGLKYLDNPKVGEEISLNKTIVTYKIDENNEQKMVKKEETVKYKLVGIYKEAVTFSSNADSCNIYRLIDPKNQPPYCSADIKLKSTNHIIKDIDYFTKTYKTEFDTSAVGDMYFQDVKGEDAETSSLLLYIICFFVFWLMLFISVFIIRNAFMISVAERTRDYGVLKCIGMSKRQLRNMLIYEGLLMSSLAIIIGMVISYIVMFIGRLFLTNTLTDLGIGEFFHIGFYLRGVVITIAFTVIATLFSLIEPARQAGLISPIDAMKGTKSIKKEKIKKNKSFGLSKLIFGIEGEYAYKNITRNRGKFISSIVGITASIMIFVCMTIAFLIVKDETVSMIEGFLGDYNGEIHNSSPIYLYDENTSDKEKNRIEEKADGVARKNIEAAYLEVQKLNGVDKAKLVYEHNSSYVVEENTSSQINREYEKIVGYSKEDIEELKSYLIEGEIDYESMKDDEVIVCNYKKIRIINDEGKEEISYVKISDLKVGDKIKVLKGNISSEWYDIKNKDKDFMRLSEYAQLKIDEGDYSEVTVKAIVKDDPLVSEVGIMFDTYDKQKLIFTKSGYIQNTDRDIYNSYRLLYKLYAENDYEIIKEYVKSKNDLQNIDLQEYIKYTKIGMNMATVILSFVVSIIMLISLINVFSNMSANLVARRLELDTYEVVGMSKKQINKMLIIENTLASIIAVILGNGLGLGIAWLGYRLVMYSTPGIKFQVPFISIFIISVGTIGITLFVTSRIAKNRKR